MKEGLEAPFLLMFGLRTLGDQREWAHSSNIRAEGMGLIWELRGWESLAHLHLSREQRGKCPRCQGIN